MVGGWHIVRQTQQLVMENPLVCAMKCYPDKCALGIKKWEKFVPSKTSRMIDFQDSYTEEERCCRNLRSSNRFLETLRRLMITMSLCVSVPYLPAVEVKTSEVIKLFAQVTLQWNWEQDLFCHFCASEHILSTHSNTWYCSVESYLQYKKSKQHSRIAGLCNFFCFPREKLQRKILYSNSLYSCHHLSSPELL